MRYFLRLITVAILACICGLSGMVFGRSASYAAAHTGRAVHHLPGESSGGSPVTVFTFGITGGNIRPWSVELHLDGSVTASGINVNSQTLQDPKNTLNALMKLADAESFFSLPSTIGCPGLGNPDVAARTVTIHSSGQTRRVVAHGSCRTHFNELYDVLVQLVGASR